jgi:hypothetical protein
MLWNAKRLRTPRTAGTETQWSSSLPTRPPRALRTVAHEAAVTEDGPHPLGEFEPSPSRVSAVVLAERATHVP